MKRRGRKSASQTPAPKKDRIKGSKVNPKGSASSSEKAKDIKFSEKTENTLKEKLKKFKEKYPSKKNVTYSDLKAVMRRGQGAYSGTHRPTIKGGMPNNRQAWGIARVNKFLKKASGEKVKKAYVQDDDLLKYKKGSLVPENTKNQMAYMNAVKMALENLKKNGIVLKDYDKNFTVITYNTGNQKRSLSLYNQSLIYKAICENNKSCASQIIVNLNDGNYEDFDESKISEYYKAKNLIICNQNEIIYSQNN